MAMDDDDIPYIPNHGAVLSSPPFTTGTTAAGIESDQKNMPKYWMSYWEILKIFSFQQRTFDEVNSLRY